LACKIVSKHRLRLVIHSLCFQTVFAIAFVGHVGQTLLVNDTPTSLTFEFISAPNFVATNITFDQSQERGLHKLMLALILGELLNQ
jgi:hypothetical protein